MDIVDAAAAARAQVFGEEPKNPEPLTYDEWFQMQQHCIPFRRFLDTEVQMLTRLALDGMSSPRAREELLRARLQLESELYADLATLKSRYEKAIEYAILVTATHLNRLVLEENASA